MNGTDTEIRAALGLSTQDMTRLRAAAGHHQRLVDEEGQARSATLDEAVAELKSRINEFVRHEEAAVGGDTIGQWGGI